MILPTSSTIIIIFQPRYEKPYINELRVITQWVPEGGRRKRGRTRLDAFMQDWLEKAMQRKEWMGMGETFAQQWDKIG